MKYTVKSKDSLVEFAEILKEQGISYTNDTPTLVEVNADNEKELDVFSNLLNYFVSFKAFGEQLTKNLAKKGFSQNEIVRIKFEELQDVANMNYFATLTNVLVKEYFKQMDTINIDSFILFNMKGFKEEIKEYVDELVKHYTNDEAPEFDENMGMSELFNVLKNRAIESGIKLEDYQELHVYQQAQFLEFKNKDGVVMDNDFLLETLGSVLQFELREEVQNVDLFEGMLICSALLQIFDMNKVVIHESVTQEAKDVLMFNLNSYKQETGKRIKVVMCNGCKQCK